MVGGGFGVIVDGINRMKSCRALTRKDRGAFDIIRRNQESIKRRTMPTFKKATPEYMAKLKEQLKRDKVSRKLKVLINLSICLVLSCGLIYLAYHIQM
jgi:alkylhydroperoxidase/carboxymuconolactone decarboxylase family protein YurZ